MDKKILVQELADALVRERDMSKKDAETFVRSVFEIVVDFLVTDKVVKIKEFGTFKLVNVDSRESVNVNTGERIRIASHAKVSFTPDKSLADQVNRPFADFETVVLNDDTPLEDMERIDMPVEPLTEQETEEPAEEQTPEPEPVKEPEPEVKEPEPEPEAVEPEPEAPAEPVVEPEKEEPQPEETPAPEPEPVAVAQAPVQQVTNQQVEELNVATQHVEHQTIQQIAEPEKQKGVHLSWGGVAAFILLALLLMAGCFYAGYQYGKKSQSTEPEVIPAAELTPAQKKAPEVQKTETTKPAAKPAAKKVPAKPNYAEIAKQYPQVEGGEYWIVGTKDTHEMAVGDNLYRIARKTYGDKEVATYIIKYNNITNPDVVPLGKELKLPELVKKE